jgi:hypothetical protein
MTVAWSASANVMTGQPSVSFTMQTYRHADDETIDRAARGFAAAAEEAR